MNKHIHKYRCIREIRVLSSINTEYCHLRWAHELPLYTNLPNATTILKLKSEICEEHQNIMDKMLKRLVS